MLTCERRGRTDLEAVLVHVPRVPAGREFMVYYQIRMSPSPKIFSFLPGSAKSPLMLSESSHGGYGSAFLHNRAAYVLPSREDHRTDRTEPLLPSTSRGELTSTAAVASPVQVRPSSSPSHISHPLIPSHTIFPPFTTNPSNAATALHSRFSASWNTKLLGE